jgi:hypothetical protein
MLVKQKKIAREVYYRRRKHLTMSLIALKK